ncbi:MAG: hypothetical protein OHK0039_48060 [Bacteroidia bacterium]
MNKTQLLALLAGGLLLCNAALIVFVLREPAGPPLHSHQPREVIIGRLGLDAAQVQAYEVLIDQHRRQIDHAERQMSALRKQLYAGLSGAGEAPAALLDSIAATQRAIESIHYQHFRSLRDLCRPDQQAAFEALRGDLARLFRPTRPPGRPPQHPPR